MNDKHQRCSGKLKGDGKNIELHTSITRLSRKQLKKVPKKFFERCIASNIERIDPALMVSGYGEAPDGKFDFPRKRSDDALSRSVTQRHCAPGPLVHRIMLDQWLRDTPGEYFDWESTVLKMPLDPDLDVIGGRQNYDFWICVFFPATAM